MAATPLPVDVEITGFIARPVNHDQSGRINYLKRYGSQWISKSRAIKTGAVAATLAVSDLLGSVVFDAAYTATQATLPATVTLLRYLKRIFSLRPRQTTEYGCVELEFVNLGTGNIELLAADVSTTFVNSVPGTSIILPPGTTTLCLEMVTGGAAPTIQIYPASGSALYTAPLLPPPPIVNPIPNAYLIMVWDPATGQMYAVDRQNF